MTRRRMVPVQLRAEVLAEVCLWPDLRIQRYDERRRELEATGLSRAAASSQAFDEFREASGLSDPRPARVTSNANVDQ